MYTFKCTCGQDIIVENGAVECCCEYCDSVFSVEELLAKQAAVEDMKARVYKEVHADEENKRIREESDTKRYVEANENKTKYEDSVIDKTKAEADFIRSKAKEAEAIAANAGKVKTIVMNGSDSSMLGDNAIKAFIDKDFQSAFTAADSVIAIDKDNLGANFIKTYKEYVVDKRPAAMNAYMARLSTQALLYEDILKLQDLFATTPVRMRDYEKQILDFVYENSVGDPAKEASACKFVDNFSPAIIASRSDRTFLTPGMVETYGNLAAFCTIPKTCHTLICSINANPESPIKSGRTYLTSVSQRFFNEYVEPIGTIVGKMKSEQYRVKFSDAYEKYKAAYRQKAGV